MNTISYWIAIRVDGFADLVNYKVHFESGNMNDGHATPCVVAKVNLNNGLPDYRRRATGFTYEEAATNLAKEVKGTLVKKS